MVLDARNQQSGRPGGPGGRWGQLTRPQATRGQLVERGFGGGGWRQRRRGSLSPASHTLTPGLPGAGLRAGRDKAGKTVARGRLSHPVAESLLSGRGDRDESLGGQGGGWAGGRPAHRGPRRGGVKAAWPAPDPSLAIRRGTSASPRRPPARAPVGSSPTRRLRPPLTGSVSCTWPLSKPEQSHIPPVGRFTAQPALAGLCDDARRSAGDPRRAAIKDHRLFRGPAPTRGAAARASLAPGGRCPKAVGRRPGPTLSFAERLPSRTACGVRGLVLLTRDLQRHRPGGHAQTEETIYCKESAHKGLRLASPDLICKAGQRVQIKYEGSRWRIRSYSGRVSLSRLQFMPSAD